MVHGGVNKVGSFLEVAVFTESGHKGIILLLEGRGGRGWCRFVNELQRMLVPLSMPFVSGMQSKIGVGETTFGCPSGRSFVEVLRMEPCAVVHLIGRRVRSLQSLDLFPVKAFFLSQGTKILSHG
jgi:hypothetical protein